jgi:OmcA/MtrC family decaheme c-type cytochrome
MTTTASPLHRVARACTLAALIALALAAPGCGGDDGDDGATGPAGPAGPPGPTDTTLTKFETAPGVNPEITSISGNAPGSSFFEPGETITVQYTLLKDDGEPWDVDEMATARILVSGPTFNYQRVIAEQSDLASASTYLGNGVWSYTFSTPIPATYLPPYNDTAAFGADDGELTGQPLLDGTYTVGMYLSWDYSVDGQSGFDDVGNATFDFLVGSTATLQPREVVAQTNCNECHVELQAHGGRRRSVVLCAMCHTAGSEDRNDPAASVGDTPGVSIDFRVMIHKIHNGAHLPSVLGVGTNPDGTRNYALPPKPYQLVGFNNSVDDFSHVLYPVWPNLSSPMPKDKGYSALTSAQKSAEDTMRGGATACFKCHGDPDGDGPIAAVPAQGAVSQTQPSRKACGSCHDDIDWDLEYKANNQTMPVVDATACNQCHFAAGTPLSVADAHVHPLEDPLVDHGIVVDITDLSGGSGAGGRFLAGDSPTLEFTLKDNAGNDVDLPDMNSSSAILVGPTNARQIVMPYASPNGISLSPYDYSGRLAASSTTNKGSMSRVTPTGAAVAETLTVEFTSATDFSVAGSVSGGLGSGTLPGSTSTNPSGSSLGSVILTSTAVPQQITVVFTDPKNFNVTGLTSGPMGLGSIPAATNASNRFSSVGGGSVSFTISAGSTPFAAGNTFNLTVFQGSAANPVLFAIVAGTSAFASAAPEPDRFYYEVVPAAASYTLTLPMDIPVEYLGNVSGGTPLAAANTPVDFGRQTVFEVTATASATTLNAGMPVQARFADVLSTAGYAVNNYAVLEPAAGVGTREYLQIGLVEPTRLGFKTPARYGHPAGVTLSKATLTYRQEGSANEYTLDRTAGTVTPVTGFTNGNAVVMSYRTDGRFGWFRHAGDTLQTVYQPPPNDSPDLGQDWGEWTGLPYLDGTYTTSIWFYSNIEFPLLGETQTYRSASLADLLDFQYGAASSSTPEPEDIIASNTTCNACHMTPTFHGLGRAGLEACLLCHGVLGAEDTPKYSSSSAPDTTGVTIAFRTMLHKIHRGADLANASTYQVAGFGGAASSYEDVIFPAMPGKTRHCIKCHGDGSTVWKEGPGDHTHPDQARPTRNWRAVCNACHDSDAATAHIATQTFQGVESCAICHGPNAEFALEIMHKPR